MNEPIIETCDLNHKYYKEAGSDTRCPHCLAIGLQAARDEAARARPILVDICNVVGACTADVSLAFLAHLPGEVKAQLAKEHQTAVDLFDVIAEIAGLVGLERSEPELCRKVVTAVRELVEADESTWESTSEFLRRNEGWLT